MGGGGDSEGEQKCYSHGAGGQFKHLGILLSNCPKLFFCTVQGKSPKFDEEPRSAGDAHTHLKGHHNPGLCDTYLPDNHIFL